MIKFLLLAGLLLCSALPSAAAEQKVVIANEADGANYSFGYQLGREIAIRKIEFRANALWQGLYDAMDQGEPRMSQEEMVLTLQQVRTSAASGAEADATALANKADAPPRVYRLKGERFIGENQQKEGVVSLSSGLQYKILASGDGKKPQATDAVLVNYRARTIDGKEFSNSYPLGIATPQEFIVNKLIPGLTEALKLMREGDRWELYLPTRLAYKDAGPLAGQTVIYDLELLEVLPVHR